MDGRRFDELTRRLTSRRAALRAGGLGLAAAVTPLARVAAYEDSPGDAPASAEDATETEAPVFLFVQPFDGGTWAPKDGTADTYTLTLTGTAAQTIYFSDRPDRITGLAPTEQFLEGLGFTPANPPNAALVAQRADTDEQDVLVVELLNPTYDATTATLTYEARVLADYGEHGLAHLASQQQDDDLGETFGAGCLFIDDCSDGRSKCMKTVDGVDSVVGTINDIGCCWSWNELECRVCNHDGHSSYYGRLCAEKFPDACALSNGAYPCWSKDRVCHGSSLPPD